MLQIRAMPCQIRAIAISVTAKLPDQSRAKFVCKNIQRLTMESYDALEAFLQHYGELSLDDIFKQMKLSESELLLPFIEFSDSVSPKKLVSMLPCMGRISRAWVERLLHDKSVLLRFDDSSALFITSLVLHMDTLAKILIERCRLTALPSRSFAKLTMDFDRPIVFEYFVQCKIRSGILHSAQILSFSFDAYSNNLIHFYPAIIRLEEEFNIIDTNQTYMRSKVQ